jgi:hypothetical protein
MAFAKFKALLRKTAVRTIDDLWPAIADSLDAFIPNLMLQLLRRGRIRPRRARIDSS